MQNATKVAVKNWAICGNFAVACRNREIHLSKEPAVCYNKAIGKWICGAVTRMSTQKM
jgi:hypothetical protein